MAALRDALNLDCVHHIKSILIEWLAMRYAYYVHYGENSMKTSLKGTLALVVTQSGIIIALALNSWPCVGEVPIHHVHIVTYSTLVLWYMTCPRVWIITTGWS